MCITDTFLAEIMRTKLLSLVSRLIQIAHIQGNAIAKNKQNA